MGTFGGPPAKQVEWTWKIARKVNVCACACVCVLIGRWRHLVPKWQTMQLWAALGFSRLAMLLRLHDIPLTGDDAASSGSAASDELINRQVGISECLPPTVRDVVSVLNVLVSRRSRDDF